MSPFSARTLLLTFSVTLELEKSSDCEGSNSMAMEAREKIDSGAVQKGKTRGIDVHTVQSHKTTLPFICGISVISFCSSRPANVCITSVPRMDKVPSNGWTGSRAVSLMPDARSQSKQKRETYAAR